MALQLFVPAREHLDGYAGALRRGWSPEGLHPQAAAEELYAVVPWTRGRGYAKESLRLMLAEARAEGLAFVTLTTDPDNVASRRVIEANGGVLVERFTRGPQYGSTPALRYRIDIDK